MGYHVRGQGMAQRRYHVVLVSFLNKQNLPRARRQHEMSLTERHLHEPKTKDHTHLSKSNGVYMKRFLAPGRNIICVNPPGTDIICKETETSFFLENIVVRGVIFLQGESHIFGEME